MAESSVKSKLLPNNVVRDLVLAEIKVDEKKYQREEVTAVHEIVASFDPSAVGTLLVGKRDDGSLWIADGQQRRAALILKGYKTWKCCVFNSRGPEHEAEVFRKANKRTPIHALTIFKAELTSQVPLAWRVKEITEKHGFTIPKSPIAKSQMNDPQIANTFIAVVALKKACGDKAYGENCLEFICRVIKKCWIGDPLRTNVDIIRGLHWFYVDMEGVVNEDHLIERLSTISARTLKNSGATTQGFKVDKSMGKAIKERYETRTKKPRKPKASE